jgi:hypothetical protein
MTYVELAKARLTPKFQDKTNFSRVMEYIGTIFDQFSPYTEMARNAKSIGSAETYILNEIGKLLGAYPRPFVPITATESTFFAYDLNGYDEYPYTSSSTGVRRLTDEEYRRYLRAIAVLTNFSGTVPEWERLISRLAYDAGVYIQNEGGSFGIVIYKTLTDADKILISSLLGKINNLTIDINFIGTVPEGTVPFTYGVSPYGIGAYVTAW